MSSHDVKSQFQFGCDSLDAIAWLDVWGCLGYLHLEDTVLNGIISHQLVFSASETMNPQHPRLNPQLFTGEAHPYFIDKIIQFYECHLVRRWRISGSSRDLHQGVPEDGCLTGENWGKTSSWNGWMGMNCPKMVNFDEFWGRKTPPGCTIYGQNTTWSGHSGLANPCSAMGSAGWWWSMVKKILSSSGLISWFVVKNGQYLVVNSACCQLLTNYWLLTIDHMLISWTTSPPLSTTNNRSHQLKTTAVPFCIPRRHSVMLVGMPFSGKTTALNTLQKALTDLAQAYSADGNGRSMALNLWLT